MKKNIIITLAFLTLLFSQNQIEGRWHFVGYEDNVMYQYVDDEFAEGGLRWTLYSTDGNFGDLEDAGGTPNPYTIDEDIITIDLHFGNIATYEMHFRCNGQVVDFYYDEDDDWEGLHSTYYREFYDYNDCANMPEECFDLSSIDFGWCDMFLGVGWNDYECEYFSGCGWIVDDIDYSEYFFDSIEECEENCQCEDGEFNNDNPCNPMECVDGQWFEIVIDCAEDMGFPCEGGLYIEPEEGECCSECIQFGDINYDYTLNILDIIQIVNIIIDHNYSEIADINFDETINILDVIEIINIILN